LDSRSGCYSKSGGRRLDDDGQVVWKRFWNAGALANNFTAVGITQVDEARLTPAGGLAMRLGESSALFFDTAGVGRRVDVFTPPAACYPSGVFPAIDRGLLTADGHLVVVYFSASGTPARACAFDASGQVVGRVDAPSGRDLRVLDFRPGIGFVIQTREAGSPTLPWQDTRLREDGTDRWLVAADLGSGEGFSLSAAGDAWLRDGADALRVIRSDGSTRAVISEAGGLDVRAWLADGDALLATGEVSDVRRLSPDGVQRWRVTRPSTSFGRADWQVVGDRARLLASRFGETEGEVLTVDLATGNLQVGVAFEMESELAAGPLGLARQITARSGKPETHWDRDPSTCLDAACAPRGVAFARTMDVRVFASSDGTALGGPPGTAFGFPTYSRLREASPGVVRDPASLDIAHARYVSDGEKERLEVARLSEHGVVRWRRVLEVPRFDVADAQLAIVNGVVHVAASSRGPLASVHRLWALDSQGQVLWERTLDEPFRQLTRVATAGGGSVLCGLGYTQRDGGPWTSPAWRCYDATGNLQVDTRLTQVPTFRDVAISHALGTRVFLRLLDAPNASSAGVQLIAIGIDGATMPGGVSWQLEPLGTAEFVRVDAVTRSSVNLVTAPVFANVNAFRPNALLVAAFDAAGTRLWQRRIDQPLRATGTGLVFTATAIDGQGVVHVAFPPNIGPDLFPLRVCRLAALDGAELGCVDTPNGGRVGALVSASETPGVWLWANEPLAGGTNQLSLLPVTADGVGAPLYQQPGLQMRLPGSLLAASDRSWTVVEPAAYSGVFGDTPPPSTRVLLFQPGRLFSDGFEDAGVR
jgi:hypothetical protein